MPGVMLRNPPFIFICVDGLGGSAGLERETDLKPFLRLVRSHGFILLIAGDFPFFKIGVSINRSGGRDHEAINSKSGHLSVICGGR